MQGRPLAFAHPRVTLYWLCPHFPPFHLLSRNITREVCGYLDDYPCLLDVISGRVQTYDPIRNRWKAVYSFHTYLDTSYFTAIVALEAGCVFLCGGLTFLSNPHTALSSAYILRPTGATKLPRMHLARYGHGALHLKSRKSVYVFGGSQGKRYDQSAGVWLSIGDMKVPRLNFTPCLHRDLVYLCGGMNPSIETYNPEIGTFALLPVKLPQEVDAKWKACSVVANDQLVVLSYSHIWKWDLRGRDKEPVVASKPASDVWSRCPPAIYGGTLLILNGTGAVGFSLETGEEVIERRSDCIEN